MSNEQKIKIYNVSPLSKIPVFEKINYTTFFNMLDKNIYNQEELREIIKQKIIIIFLQWKICEVKNL